METSMHYPFIYFLYDTNQVLVYKIQALEYITITDVMRKGNGRGLSFSHLNHLRRFIMSKARLSRDGLFVAQEQLHHLVEIINDYIQQVMTTTSAQMVHIVCSESAAGSLRVALAPPKYVIGFPEDLSIGPLWKLDEKGTGIP